MPTSFQNMATLTYTGGIIFLCFWLNASAPAENR